MNFKAFKGLKDFTKRNKIKVLEIIFISESKLVQGIYKIYIKGYKYLFDKREYMAFKNLKTLFSIQNNLRNLGVQLGNSII